MRENDPYKLRCSKCKKMKFDDDFNENVVNVGRRGKHSYCKECLREYKDEYRKRPEVIERKRLLTIERSKKPKKPAKKGEFLIEHVIRHSFDLSKYTDRYVRKVCKTLAKILRE